MEASAGRTRQVRPAVQQLPRSRSRNERRRVAHPCQVAQSAVRRSVKAMVTGSNPVLAA